MIVGVDVGNSRLKWGRFAPDGLDAIASLALDDPADWDRQAAAWQVPTTTTWIVASVAPPLSERFAAWAASKGGTVRRLEHAVELPLVCHIPEPDKAGIDRLLAAVGANRRRFPNTPAVLVLVGTALVVDALDTNGAFLGGAILPGPRLMGRALHDHTALLPLVERVPFDPPAPATATRSAIELGVHAALVGGAVRLIDIYRRKFETPPRVFVSGGGAELLAPHLGGDVIRAPHLVLEGLRATAEGWS